MTKHGQLFIVATPIGNLEDITLRAIETLKTVDLIAAEDTRHSKKLLNHYNIKTKTISLHNYNEIKRSHLIINKLKQGKNIALISDSGTPLISDPGNPLVQKAHENKIQTVPIPGACAAITSLSASGLPTDRFIFEGFLSSKQKKREECLKSIKNETRTVIFYEAPHRLLSTIDNMQNIFGSNRYIVIAKELTKKFETIYGGTIFEVKNWLNEDRSRLKGEFVILLRGEDKKTDIDQKTIEILELLSKNMSQKQAIALTANITGENKNKLYKLSIKTTKLEKN